MPGPKNTKKKRKAQAKKAREKERRAAEAASKHEELPEVVEERFGDERYEEKDEDEESFRIVVEDTDPPRERYMPLKSQPLRYVSHPPKPHAHTHPPASFRGRHGPRDTPPASPSAPPSAFSSETSSPNSDVRAPQDHESGDSEGEYGAPAPPCVEDHGNGPHVRDIRAFLRSRLCAPPSMHDDLCAEFAREEVREMLGAVLPEEMALIVWHNKSRHAARICPACRRLYRLGELVREPLLDEHSPPPTHANTDAGPESERRQREQEISGICSALCFMLVAYRFPAAIRSTWGRTADALSDATWAELDAPLPPNAADDGLGFSMALKMTRCPDLGLAQLFGVESGDEEGGDGEEEGESEDDVLEY
ncbi:hypothetical protein PsYK624_049990 [Phanerochaete sordida]|uniref:Uncharacterized protein n=1 Tax=Phanerochaete sordida TaxID=48140 RepID=A0A9P3G607_9APHY|nr:hypothetical protein PsYK624_049990 [Phanerochaete sordida]